MPAIIDRLLHVIIVYPVSQLPPHTDNVVRCHCIHFGPPQRPPAPVKPPPKLPCTLCLLSLFPTPSITTPTVTCPSRAPVLNLVPRVPSEDRACRRVWNPRHAKYLTLRYLTKCLPTYLSQTHLNHSLPARCSQLSPRHKHKHQQSTSFADTSARSSHHRHLRTALLPHALLPQPPRPPYRHSGAAPILTTSQPVFRHRRQTVFHITPVAGRHHLRGGSQHSPATVRADRRAQDEHQQ